MVQASFESRVRRGRRPACCNTTGREAFDAVRMLKSRRSRRSTRPRTAPSTRASAYGEALRQIAQLIKADVGLEVAFAEAGGWDHHVNEGAAVGQLATRLDDFARGIAALARDLGDRMEDVVILTMSEFGRAVAENGNRGTDHGHGNAMMVIGGRASAAARSTAAGRAWRASSATRAATWRSRPTSERVRRGRARPSRPDRHQPRVSGVQGSGGRSDSLRSSRQIPSSKLHIPTTPNSQTPNEPRAPKPNPRRAQATASRGVGTWPL